MRVKRLLSVLLVCLLLSGCGAQAGKTTITEPSDDSGSIESNAGDDTVMESGNQILLTVNGQTLMATLAENSSAQALKELLTQGPLTISMRDYDSMEKVGDIGTDLPTNDEQITTEAGDLILYMGSAFVIYYAPNSWNFTRLGKINDITAQELKDLLGGGDVQVTLTVNTES